MNSPIFKYFFVAILGLSSTVAFAADVELESISLGDFVALLQVAQEEANQLSSAIKSGKVDRVRQLMSTSVRPLLLVTSLDIPNLRKWNRRDAGLWKTLLEYAPQLAYDHGDLPGVGHLGQLEAAFYFRDIERTAALEYYHFPYDHDLLMAMLSHNPEMDENEYMEFMREVNPVAYYLAYFGASIGHYAMQAIQFVKSLPQP